MSALLNIENLKVYFGDPKHPIRAVDGVGLSVGPGESVGLVGESGCGKSTLGRAILRLEPPKEGRILFDGEDVTSFKGKDLKSFRRQSQMIFQDPFESLNPRLSIGSALNEVLFVHHDMKKSERVARIEELLSDVGLDPAYRDRYPHEFSGGQRQRIGIARALALNPSLIIADEPVSALDVSVQVQILNLLKELQEKWNLSYLFVAHDLAVVRYMCDRLYVMYLGKIVESGPAEQIYAQPTHPYTEALLSAVPDVDRGLKADDEKQGRIILQGDVPSAAQLIPGCPFHPRCHRAQDRCGAEVPELRDVGEGRCSACHFAEKLGSGD